MQRPSNTQAFSLPSCEGSGLKHRQTDLIRPDNNVSLLAKGVD